MSLDQDIEILSRVDLFKGFEKEHLRLLAFGADKRTFKPQSVIFRSGSHADGGYVILHDSIDIMTDDSKDAKRLASFGPASLIGELALISKGRRDITAVARGDVETLKITRVLFHRMLEEFPDLAALLHTRISRSVQEFVSRLTDVQRDLDRVDGV